MPCRRVFGGTTPLFSALDVAADTAIGTCMKWQRVRGFRSFVDVVSRVVPADLDIHVIMDSTFSHQTNQSPRNRHLAPPAASSSV